MTIALEIYFPLVSTDNIRIPIMQIHHVQRLKKLSILVTRLKTQKSLLSPCPQTKICQNKKITKKIIQTLIMNNILTFVFDHDNRGHIQHESLYLCKS